MDVAEFGLPRVASQGAISVSASHTSVNDHESIGDHSVRDARDGIASALGVLRGVYDGTVGMTDAAELLREVPSYFPSAPFPPTPSNTPLVHRGSDTAAGGVASSLCSPEAAAAPPPPPFFSPAQACSVLSGHIETPGTEAQREVSPTRLVVKQLHRILVDVSHMVRDSDATLLRAAEYGSFLLEEGREKKEELQEAERHRKQVAELMEQNLSLRSEVALWKGVDKRSHQSELLEGGVSSADDDWFRTKVYLQGKINTLQSRNVELEAMNRGLLSDAAGLREQISQLSLEHQTVEDVNLRLGRELSNARSREKHLEQSVEKLQKHGAAAPGVPGSEEAAEREEEALAGVHERGGGGSYHAALDLFLSSPTASNPNCDYCNKHYKRWQERLSAITAEATRAREETMRALAKGLEVLAVKPALLQLREQVLAMKATFSAPDLCSPFSYAFVSLRDCTHFGEVALVEAQRDLQLAFERGLHEAQSLKDERVTNCRVNALKRQQHELEVELNSELALVRSDNRRLSLAAGGGESADDKLAADNYLEWQNQLRSIKAESAQERAQAHEMLRRTQHLVRTCTATLQKLRAPVVSAVAEHTQRDVTLIQAAVTSFSMVESHRSFCVEALAEGHTAASSAHAQLLLSVRTPPPPPPQPAAGRLDSSSLQNITALTAVVIAMQVAQYVFGPVS